MSWRWDALLAAVVTVHLVAAPFTKVEESFNVQAMHDIQFHGRNVIAYDHNEFPGVVPRTFVGALVVSAAAAPLNAALMAVAQHKQICLFGCRLILGLFNVAALGFFRRAWARRFRDAALGPWIVLVTCAQFHLCFYMSRPLPNTFALAVIVCAYACWLNGDASRVVGLLAVATIVFRCDTAVLALPVLLTMWLVTREVSFKALLVSGVCWSVGAIAVTVVVDSLFWRRLLWPEFDVFSFNFLQDGAQNSSKWGVSPPLWYVTSALPRALLGALPFVPVGLCRAFAVSTAAVDWDMCGYCAPVVAFVALYSFLPHKELRFIFAAIPVLNAVAATGIRRLERAVHARKMPAAVGWWVPRLALVASATLTAVFLYASAHNYPGGVAFATLHDTVAAPPAAIHIDDLAATSGVSRFGERAGYTYSKALAGVRYTDFDFLLSERAHVDGFERVVGVDGFVRVDWRAARLVLEPLVYIHRNANRTLHQP